MSGLIWACKHCYEEVSGDVEFCDKCGSPEIGSFKTDEDGSVTEEVSEEQDKPKFQISMGLPGWVCPKCGSVYSPSTSECWRCNGSGITITN